MAADYRSDCPRELRECLLSDREENISRRACEESKVESRKGGSGVSIVSAPARRGEIVSPGIPKLPFLLSSRTFAVSRASDTPPSPKTVAVLRIFTDCLPRSVSLCLRETPRSNGRCCCVRLLDIPRTGSTAIQTFTNTTELGFTPPEGQLLTVTYGRHAPPHALLRPGPAPTSFHNIPPSARRDGC